jgi:hypothetical protein
MAGDVSCHHETGPLELLRKTDDTTLSMHTSDAIATREMDAMASWHSGMHLEHVTHDCFGLQRAPRVPGATLAMRSPRSPSLVEQHVQRMRRNPSHGEPHSSVRRSAFGSTSSGEIEVDLWSPPRALSPVQSARAAVLSRGDSPARKPPKASSCASRAGDDRRSRLNSSPQTQGEWISRRDAGFYRDTKARDPDAPRTRQAKSVMSTV